MAQAGQIARSTAAPPAEGISYEDLYRRWERSNWSATDIDLSGDRSDWSDLDPADRRAMLWHLGAFAHGENEVAVSLAAYIDAAPREEQRYFLATQQVDEARHSVFFSRFMREVPSVGGGVGETLDLTRPELTWGFRRTFERLERMVRELRSDRSPRKLAGAVTLYHLVIEAAMAQTSLHFLESHLEETGRFPGLREGLASVLNDEQRHIGFGVKLLHDLSTEYAGCRHEVAEVLHQVTPFSVAVAVPPNGDESYMARLGYRLEDLHEASTSSLVTRLRSAGLAADDLPGPPALPRGLSPAEQARKSLVLLRANVLGEKRGVPDRSPEVMETLFDLVGRSADLTQASPGGDTIQWDFTDAEPWHVHITREGASAARGRAPRADLTWRCAFEDWTDVVARRIDSGRALLTRRLRPRGSVRLLLRSRAIFGA